MEQERFEVEISLADRKEPEVIRCTDFQIDANGHVRLFKMHKAEGMWGHTFYPAHRVLRVKAKTLVPVNEGKEESRIQPVTSPLMQ